MIGSEAAELEFCLLGPLQVRCGGAIVGVRPGKQRAVLAALLLDANRVVPLEELAEALWGHDTPPSARVTVQNYVKRLRHALGEAGRPRIQTQPRGYLITVEAGELDVSRFATLLGSARTAARDGSWDVAAADAREALTLWRGEPLADIESELLAMREVPRIVEMRLQALEARIEADLHLGGHAEVIAELRHLIGIHPLREHLHALLMLALHLAGRQAEALAAYRHARRMVIDELGTEPGIELRDLHQRILTGDAVLAAPAHLRLAGHGARPAVPRQLPAPVRHFGGRTAELAALTRLLEQAGAGTPGALVISAIGGTAGVGKTALAVHWAHQVAGHFPDGQLYVNLRGYDPGQPMSAADALAGFLRALGMSGQDIPPETGERAARYRSLLAGRRMLVILDNAGHAEQVRPLLPGTLSCVALITSRDSLTGLVARDGARRLDLDLLPLADAVGLLRALLGKRIDADPAAPALADRCARLPLALRVAAELAAARPAEPLSVLVDELADRQQRLDLLDAGGDPRSAVRAVFSWSLAHLDPAAASAFRLIGLHPGPNLDRYAATALTGTSLEATGHLLSQLVRAHLIQPAGPGRYGMHDLLRSYACELAAATGEQDAQRTALTRLFDYYADTCAVATSHVFPAESRGRPRAESDLPAPALTDAATARAWLDTELACLVAVTACTAADGWPDHTSRLATTLFRYLDVGGYHSEAIAVHSNARRAASLAGDLAAEAAALTNLGVADHENGHDSKAADHLRQALTLFLRIGDLPGQARAVSNLGGVELLQGRYGDAYGHFEQAFALRQETGDLTGQARALSNLGRVDLLQGRYAQAGGRLGQALALCRDIGDHTGEAYILNYLGRVELMRGSFRQATGYLEQALALNQEIGNRPGEAYVLANLGLVQLRQGSHSGAASQLRTALALFRETGDRSGEAEALNGLGEVLLAAGEPGPARDHSAEALGLAGQIGDKHERARAHNGLGCCYLAEGDRRRARQHWEEALVLYAGLGAPQAQYLRAELSAMDPGASGPVSSVQGRTRPDSPQVKPSTTTAPL